MAAKTDMTQTNMSVNERGPLRQFFLGNLKKRLFLVSDSPFYRQMTNSPLENLTALSLDRKNNQKYYWS